MININLELTSENKLLVTLHQDEVLARDKKPSLLCPVVNFKCCECDPKPKDLDLVSARSVCLSLSLFIQSQRN
jgi:hypothetical protein